MNHALLPELISDQLAEQACLIQRDQTISWTEMTDRTRPEIKTTATATIDSMRNKISGYKLPRLIYFVEKLHRNPNGKPDFKWAHNEAKEHTKKRPNNPPLDRADVDSPGR